ELEALQQGGMEGERDQALSSLQGAQGSEAPVVHPPPGAFELLPGDLPFVELSLPDLTPAFEASHRSLQMQTLIAVLYLLKIQLQSFLYQYKIPRKEWRSSRIFPMIEARPCRTSTSENGFAGSGENSG